MIYQCPICSKSFQSDVAAVVECPHCGKKVKIEGSLACGSPWDRASRGGWTGAFFETAKSSIVDPIRFFGEVRKGEGWVRPWIYNVVTLSFVFMVSMAYQLGFQTMAVGFSMAHELKKMMLPVAALSLPMLIMGIIIATIIIIPLFATLALFLQAGLNHLCLMILGSARRDFWTTFRAICYSSGPQLFHIVPLFGALVAPIWQIVLVVMGLKVSHDISYGKSALAVFLPTIICCSLLLLTLPFIAGGVLTALSHGAH